jgi:putative ABC transport system permease protein
LPQASEFARKEAATAPAPASARATRSLLVIGEVSRALVLLIGAALLIRTFLALRQVNPDFLVGVKT